MPVFHRLWPDDNLTEEHLHPMAIIDRLNQGRPRTQEVGCPKTVRVDLAKGYDWPMCTAFCYENCRASFGQKASHIVCLAKQVPVAQLLAFVFGLKGERYFLDGVNTGYFRAFLDRMLSEGAALKSKLIVVSESRLSVDSWSRSAQLTNLVVYFCSPGNGERELVFHGEIPAIGLVPDLIKACLQFHAFTAAQETQGFARGLVFRTRQHSACVELLTTSGHVPLVIEDATLRRNAFKFFLVKNSASGDSLCIRIGPCEMRTGTNRILDYFVRILRLSPGQTIDDILYDDRAPANKCEL